MDEALRHGWQRAAQDLLNAHGGGPEQKPIVLRKALCADFQHLKALDHSLQVATGLGLSHFQVDEDACNQSAEAAGSDELAASLGPSIAQPQSLAACVGAPQPTLAVSCDQGGGLLQALFFLVYRARMCLVIHSDISHRVWKDCKQSIVEAGWCSHVLLQSVCMNLDYGPFEGATWFHKACDAISCFFYQSSTCHDSLFQNWLPGLLRGHVRTSPRTHRGCFLG